MRRLILAVLLLGLVTLLVPSLRERAQPRIDRSREWLGVHLEGPMSPILNPYRRLKTESQIGKAVSELLRRRNLGMPPPEPQEFQDFMASHEFAEEGVDAWGTPFRMVQGADSLSIVSGGPDFQFDTGDDIVVSLRYAAPARRGGRSRR